MTYILVAPDGRRIEWAGSAGQIEDRARTFNLYHRGPEGSAYTIQFASADLIVNEYPQDEIPEPGGYNLIAVMDDGDVLCEWCVRDPFNPIEDRRKDHHAGGYTGWGLVGWSTTGDTDSYTVCANCNRVLVEDTETEE